MFLKDKPEHISTEPVNIIKVFNYSDEFDRFLHEPADILVSFKVFSRGIERVGSAIERPERL